MFFLKGTQPNDFGLEQYFSKMLSGSKLLAYVELVRPWNGVVTGFIAVLGALFALHTYSDLLKLVVLFCSFTLAYNAGTILNDIFDQKIDQINMPYRPIQAKKVSEKNAIILSAFLHVFTFALALWLSWQVALIMLTFFIFSAFYSVPPVRFVARGFLSQLDLAFTVAFIPLYAGTSLVTGKLSLSNHYILTYLVFSILFSFLFLVKDYKDVEGDQVGGKHTVVLSLGKERTKMLMIVGTTVFYLASIFFFYQLTQDSILAIIGVGVLLITLYFQRYTIQTPGKTFAANRLLLAVFLVATVLALKSVF